MITCSAPGKIFLFGEHSVVYKKTAIACAINRRACATLTPSRFACIKVYGKCKPLHPEKNPYISAAIEAMNRIADLPGFCIEINSELPVGSGLGSSAAVTIATIKALDVLADTKLTLAEIAEMGHGVETKIQGKASPTDTFVSTFGGLVKIPDRINMNFFDATIVVGNTGRFALTRNIVSNVAALKNRNPDIVEKMLDAMNEISLIGENEINAKNYKKIGELMNINHGLLSALGVSTDTLEKLVWAARNNGALGAKITGSGGGGCMIALCEKRNIKKVVQSIKKAGGETIVCRTTQEGVRADHIDMEGFEKRRGKNDK